MQQENETPAYRLLQNNFLCPLAYSWKQGKVNFRYNQYSRKWEFSFLKGQTHNSVISCIKDREDWNEKAETPSTIR